MLLLPEIMIKVTSLLTISFLLLVSNITIAEEQKIYPTIESFKSQLSVGMIEEKNLDINNDGQPDALIYTTGGEETYLDILLGEDDHFLLVRVPVAEEYEILSSPAGYELRIGRGTFPSFGDVHGSDKYLWYDFYEVDDNALKLSNQRHPKFYEKMVPLYQQRIKELEGEIQMLEEKQSAGQGDPRILEVYIQWRRDHIARYQEFVRKGSAILLATESEYEAERKKLPPLVFQLFYAVKDSLDYGYIEGHGEPPQPEASLEEYSRVTSELLETFEKEYQILQYERIGDDYVLIVSSKANPQEKYKATRMEKYVFSNEQWKSLGGYLSF